MGDDPAVKTVRKLIEVALPLDDISRATAREKSIRQGHPSTLHPWWARRPLAAARAVLFAQLVDDPSSRPERFPTKEEQDEERARLFAILRRMVQWPSKDKKSPESNPKSIEEAIGQAREEIRKSWQRTCADNTDHPQTAELFDPEKLPAFHDPFAGGGAIPLEAQRLGLESHASDLNPVAVLINKAMIEIPPKFTGRPPVNPESRKGSLRERQWKGVAGLAADVRHYGQWMRDEAAQRIGHLYPKVSVTEDMASQRSDLKRYVGRELTVIAWLWARTVRSPNPAFADVDVPLVSNYLLSTKRGKKAWVEAVIERRGFRFRVRSGIPPDLKKAKMGTSAGKRAGFRCLISRDPIKYGHIKDQGRRGALGERLMAIVAQGDNERVYLDPIAEHQHMALAQRSDHKPDLLLQGKARANVGNYGLMRVGELFTERQLTALTTLADLVCEAREKAHQDAVTAERERERERERETASMRVRCVKAAAAPPPTPTPFRCTSRLLSASRQIWATACAAGNPRHSALANYTEVKRYP